MSIRAPASQPSSPPLARRSFDARRARHLRSLPEWYIAVLVLALVGSVWAALEGSFTALVWATRLGASSGLVLFLSDLQILWRRGGIVGRLVLNFGVLYWFWVGAWGLALADPPFPWVDEVYPGFLFGIPASIVATALIAVNLFALAAMLGWRYLPQPRRLIAWFADRLDPQPSQWLDLMALGLVLLAWVPLLYAYRGDLVAVLHDLLQMRAGGTVGASQDAGLAHHLVLVGVFGAALSLARIALRSPGLSWPRYLAVALMAPILFFGQGSRFNFGYLLMPAVVILMAPGHHQLSWVSRRATLILVVAIGAFLILYQGAIRNTGFQVSQVSSISIDETIESGFYGHDHFSAMLVAINMVEKKGGFYFEPMTPFFITHFIPSRIWPGKPYPVSWTDYNFEWTQGAGFNVTPSITGQYYLNWGYAGVIYIGFFMGWLARLCEGWFARLDLRYQLMSASVAGLLLGFVFLSFRFFYPLYFSFPLFGFLVYSVLARRYYPGLIYRRA